MFLYLLFTDYTALYLTINYKYINKLNYFVP